MPSAKQQLLFLFFAIACALGQATPVAADAGNVIAGLLGACQSHAQHSDVTRPTCAERSDERQWSSRRWMARGHNRASAREQCDDTSGNGRQQPAVAAVTHCRWSCSCASLYLFSPCSDCHLRVPGLVVAPRRQLAVQRLGGRDGLRSPRRPLRAPGRCLAAFPVGLFSSFHCCTVLSFLFFATSPPTTTGVRFLLSLGMPGLLRRAVSPRRAA